VHLRSWRGRFGRRWYGVTRQAKPVLLLILLGLRLFCFFDFQRHEDYPGPEEDGMSRAEIAWGKEAVLFLRQLKKIKERLSVTSERPRS
jgi:hypothetical protein